MGTIKIKLPNDKLLCCNWECTETRYDKDKYCRPCRKAINQEYKKRKKIGYVEKLRREFIPDPRLSMPDIKEWEGLPIAWSDVTRKEFSTKWSFNNYKFKLISNRIK